MQIKIQKQIQAPIQTGRKVGKLHRQGKAALTADGAVSQILAHVHHHTGVGRL